MSLQLICRRAIIIFFGLFFSLGLSRAAVAGNEAEPSAVAKGLCDALLASMKNGSALDYTARKEHLAPEINRAFDLPSMTRIMVGPMWKNIAADDRQKLVDAFGDFTISTYAQRFKSYDGERFEVDPTPTVTPRGESIVHTKLFTGDPKPVQLDYLMRKGDSGWQAIDIFLSGTISELATRRSEYSSILREGGAPALIASLKKKTDELKAEGDKPH